MTIITDIMHVVTETTISFKPSDKLTLTACGGSQASQQLNFLTDHSFWVMSYGDWITITLACIAVITFVKSMGLFSAIKRIIRKLL